jgi:hypothetical protein
MRWATEVEPVEGAERVRRFFALFPASLSDGTTAWLQNFYVHERYVVEYEVDLFVRGNVGRWEFVSALPTAVTAACHKRYRHTHGGYMHHSGRCEFVARHGAA